MLNIADETKVERVRVLNIADETWKVRRGRVLNVFVETRKP